MKRSFRACMANLGAIVLFFVLLVIAAIAITIAVQIVGFIVSLLAGETAMLFVVQILMMAVLMPVVTGAMYFAWKQLIAGADASAPSSRDSIVEA